MLQDPRQKRFFKAKDMSDLFVLGSEYATATETADIFAGLDGSVAPPGEVADAAADGPGGPDAASAGERLEIQFG